MENASKALLIAASVLIGVMLLSFGVYLFNMFADYSKTTTEQLTQRQIDEFNSQFSKYEGSKTCRIHDVISIANLAKQNNLNYEYTDTYIGPYYITVNITNLSPASKGKKLENLSIEKINELIKEYSLNNTDSNKINFECTKVEINSTTKRVSSITFKKL